MKQHQQPDAKDAATAPVQVPEGQDLADALKELQKKVILIQEGTFSAPELALHTAISLGSLL